MIKLSHKWIVVILLIPVLSLTAKKNDIPLQIRFNQPTTLQGALPWISKNDPYWERVSLPIGNGHIGASVYGAIETERISLNEKSLWTGGPNSGDVKTYWDANKQSASIVNQIREAFLQGNDEKAAELTYNNMNGNIAYQRNEGTPWYFGNFTTLGELHIQTGVHPDNATDYSRVLSLDSAMTTVRFRSQGITYIRESFCSYPDNILVMRYKADRKGKQNLKLSYHPNPLAEGRIFGEGTDALCYSARLKDNQMEFCIRIKAMAKGGEVFNHNQTLEIKDADEVVFLLTADTDYQMNFDPDFEDPKAYVGPDPKQTTRQWLNNAAAMNYQKLLKRHLQDYQTLFSRVQLQLNEKQPQNLRMATPDRLVQYRQGSKDNYLEALYFQFGRYLLLASSRKGALPANLQGIWSNDIEAPWHSDYHNNINIQMNYWPVMQDNLQECFQPFVDYVKTQVKPGRITAQSYYGARGWTSSISANPFGFTAPLTDKNMQFNLCPTVGPWLATHLWDYYDYTRDLNWLWKEGYPIIREAALFAQDYLWKKPDGTYTAAPSTSPEHGIIDEGATFAHAVIREILLDAIDAAKVLNVDGEQVSEWQEILKHLPPYKIGRYGQILEWSRDIDDPNDHHRHVNHLFGLHPGHTIDPLTMPELAKAAKVVLEHRGDGATGWSMGWKLNQWARLHDGNHAYVLYGNLLKNGTADNLWDLHPPFQIDGNFGGTAGVTEMLLQSHAGCIHLLPALPDAWRSGEVKGLRARGNFEVDILWQENRLGKAVIYSGSGGSCTVRYGEKTLTFPTKKGKTYIIIVQDGCLKVK